MAKKKVNIEIPRSGAAAEVPSGDVNIVYNDVRIAGLSETVDATLKTGGTVVQHDIEVEYTKPSPDVITIPVYTVVERGSPSFVKDISGVPGSVVEETIPTPNGATSFNRVNANWCITIDGANTVIKGYIPSEITENVYIAYND